MIDGRVAASTHSTAGGRKGGCGKRVRARAAVPLAFINQRLSAPVRSLTNAMFRVQLDNGHEILGHVAGKMRRYRIRILLGDRVKVELSPYDLKRGRITYRYR